MKALVVGASAGVGRALSEALAQRGHELLLVASDATDLEVQAAHLRMSFGARVEHVAANASDPDAFLAAIMQASEPFGDIEGLFLPIGVSSYEDCDAPRPELARMLIDANLVSVMSLVATFLPPMLSANRGVVVGFGSVAAIRGRRVNVAYSAAKRALQSYFESLRHATADSAVCVQLYQLGYVDTQQTFGRRLLFRPVQPARIAEHVVASLGRDIGTRYVPRYWALVAWLVASLPWFVFKHLRF